MEKQEAILETALKLFVQYGFHGTPTSKIASEAGISQGIIFHYFKTKDDLVAALYSRIKLNFNTYLATHIIETDEMKEKFRKLFFYSIEWALKNKDEFYFSQQFHYSPHLRLIATEEIEKQNSINTELLKEAMKAQVFKPISLELVGALSSSSIIGVYNYLANAGFSPAKQTREINKAFEMLWTMLANS